MNSIPKSSRYIEVVTYAWTKCLPKPYGTQEYMSDGVETHCNQFVQDICVQLGYEKMAGMTANGMADFLYSSTDFLSIDGGAAQFHANNGVLVIAAWRNPIAIGHGHVCVVIPGTPTTSEQWGIKTPRVPKVANVSLPEMCFMNKWANFAFGKTRIPSYYVLQGMVS
jgi:hypothetical protein